MYILVIVINQHRNKVRYLSENRFLSQLTSEKWYMWLNDLFWGIRNTFVGKYHFLVINDHLWGPSVHVDKSLKKNPGKGQTPSHPGIVFWDRMVHQPLSYFSTDSKCQKVKKDSFGIQIQWVMANAGVVTWDLRQSKSLLGGEGVKWEWDGMLAGWGKWGDQKGAAETGRNCKKVGGRVG